MKRLLRLALLLILGCLITLACGTIPSPAAVPEENNPDLPTQPPTSVPSTPTLQSSTPPPSDAINPPIEEIPQPTTTPSPTATPIVYGPISAVLPVSQIMDGDFYDLHFIPGEGLWLLTNTGAARFKNDTWEIMLQFTEGIPAGMDASGRVWVLQPDLSAMHYWQDDVWNLDTIGWKPITGYYAPPQQELRSDAAGNLWYATPQDIRYFDGVRWTVLPPEQIKMSAFDDEDIIRRFSIDFIELYDEIWVGHCYWSGPGPFRGLGARWYDGENWRGSTSPFSSGCVSSFAVDEEAYLVWSAADDIIWSFNRVDGNWTEYPPPPAVEPYTRYGAVLSLALDQNGDPWAAFLACGGASCDAVYIYRFKDGHWQPIGSETEMWLDEKILFDEQGTAWIFTNGSGILQVIDGIPQQIAPLPAQGVTIDDTGNIWFVDKFKSRDSMLWKLTTNTK
jgi:hypothetical protein